LIARFAVILGVAGALAGCAELIGIHEIGSDAGDDGGDAQSSDAPIGACTNVVLTLSTPPDRVVFANGYLYVVSAFGVSRCAVTGTCVDPPLILQAPAASTFQAADIATSLVYTLQNTSSGSVHSTTLDAVGDQVLFSDPTASPWLVAVSGTRTYWLDDVTNDVHCIGCVGPGDATWISGLSGNAALLAAPNVVYTLANGAKGFGVYGCGPQACSNQPTPVLGALDIQTKQAQIAADGNYVYVSRVATNDVVSVDSLGAMNTVAHNLAASAIALDSASGELVYGTPQGEVGLLKTDGSSRTPLASCVAGVLAIALDATHAYVLVDNTSPGGPVAVYAIAR
jgi:hypothetical protein